MRQWDSAHFKLFITELLWKSNSIFYTICCKIPFKIPFKIIQNHYFLSFLIFLQLKRIIIYFLLIVWYVLRPNQRPTVSPVSPNCFQSIKKHLTIKQRDDQSIVPPIYMEDCRICNLGTNMANSFHTLGYKINLFVLAKTCYSKHLLYEERQRREHAMKLQSFP